MPKYKFRRNDMKMGNVVHSLQIRSRKQKWNEHLGGTKKKVFDVHSIWTMELLIEDLAFGGGKSRGDLSLMWCAAIAEVLWKQWCEAVWKHRFLLLSKFTSPNTKRQSTWHIFNHWNCLQKNETIIPDHCKEKWKNAVHLFQIRLRKQKWHEHLWSERRGIRCHSNCTMEFVVEELVLGCGKSRGEFSLMVWMVEQCGARRSLKFSGNNGVEPCGCHVFFLLTNLGVVQ